MNEDYIPSLKYSKSHNTIIFSSILCFGNFRSEGFTFFFLVLLSQIIKRYILAACMLYYAKNIQELLGR